MKTSLPSSPRGLRCDEPKRLLQSPARRKFAAFSISHNSHFSFGIFHLPFVASCFVSVRVISWIVLHFSAKQPIHEVARSIT